MVAVAPPPTAPLPAAARGRSRSPRRGGLDPRHGCGAAGHAARAGGPAPAPRRQPARPGDGQEPLPFLQSLHRRCPSSRRGGRPRARAVVAVLELVPWWRAMGAAEDAVQQLGLLMELWDVVHRTCGRGGGAGVRALSRLHPEQLCILLQPELGSMTNLLDAQEYLLQEGCRPPSTRTSRDTCSSSSSLLSCT
ncbi:uncharacterized protein [Triticum aestivum]|uniref:uncharacterized protein isoform X1 n=1 Tax=Triticum aestivum TaxID=4565 RepID=UPI001D02E0A2|nr:uncharacterized protein LOC123158865 isoform X1 [Triticum aestivum]